MQDSTEEPKARRGLGPFSGGQLTAIVIVLLVVIGLPVGAFATLSFSNVSITDPGGVYRAHVDGNGTLQVRPNGYAAGAFTLHGSTTGGGVKLKLPKCATTSCHMAISDIVMNQTNNTNSIIGVDIFVAQDSGFGNCSGYTGSALAYPVQSFHIAANQVMSINLATPVTFSFTAPLECLVIVTDFSAGLLFSYQVTGFRQTY